jgi:hypothetical protein
VPSDLAGELAIEFRLLGEDPAEHAPYRHSRRLRARRAERYALGERGIKQACHEQKADDGSGQHSDMKYASLPDGFHGYPHRKLVPMTIAGATLRDGYRRNLCLREAGRDQDEVRRWGARGPGTELHVACSSRVRPRARDAAGQNGPAAAAEGPLPGPFRTPNESVRRSGNNRRG